MAVTDLAVAIRTTEPMHASPRPTSTPPGSTSHAVSKDVPTPGEYDQLRVLAETYEDIQRTRVGVENRVKSLSVPADVVAPSLKSLVTAEKQVAEAMHCCFRRTAPAVHAWVEETVGLGEHTFARLLGAIGHPVIAQPYHWEGEGNERRLVADEPYFRSVSQLWSYCGHGDPSLRRRKGMMADEAAALGNPRAKTLVFLIARSIKLCAGTAISATEPMAGPPAGALQSNEDGPIEDPNPKVGPARPRSPYRDVYEAARARYATEDKWASNKHRDNSALRVTGKAVLKDLWLVAREDLA